MRNFLTTLIGLGALSAAYATPITTTFTDIVNPTDFKMTKQGANETYTYVHNINDNGFLSGTHTITGASLFIDLADDGDQPSENVRVKLDNIVVGNSMHVNSSNFTFVVTSSMLQTDGLLQVKLEAISGDFWFRDSQLDVTATSPAAVPEPGTMALMALGLLGLGAVARRRK